MRSREKRPLDGVRALEVGTYVAAPSLGLMLALLGAEVVKVEPPGGDITRTLTPWSWVNYNFLKKSIVIDLKSGKGVEVFRRLAKKADVIIEALSPGSASSLGIGFEQLRRLNRRLVYCSLKGFSSGSAYSNRPAFDTIAQAEGGLMHVTMTEGSKEPGRVGNPSVDLTAATFSLVNILAQMIANNRRNSASYIEVALYDVVSFWNSYWFPYIDEYKKEPEFLGSVHPGYSPYGVFKCADGYVFIGVISDRQWKSLVEKLDLEASGLDKMNDRIAERKRVNQVLQERLKDITKGNLIKMIGKEVPCAEVNSLTQAMKKSEILSPNSMKIVRYNGISYHVFLPPLGMSNIKQGRNIRLKPPDLGADTKDLMKEAGYVEDEINYLISEGIVA